MKNENEVGPDYSKEDMDVKREENVKVAPIKDKEKHSSYGSTSNFEDEIEDSKENNKAATAEDM